MGAAVAMTRLDLTAGELRRAAGKEKNGTVARRILALALVLEGSRLKRRQASLGVCSTALRNFGVIERACWERLQRVGAQSRPLTMPAFLVRQVTIY